MPFREQLFPEQSRSSHLAPCQFSLHSQIPRTQRPWSPHSGTHLRSATQRIVDTFLATLYVKLFKTLKQNSTLTQPQCNVSITVLQRPKTKLPKMLKKFVIHMYNVYEAKQRRSQGKLPVFLHTLCLTDN